MSKIIALTDAGKRLALILTAHIEGSELCYKPKPFTETVQRAFLRGERLIFICASGIVIRTLAPVLNDKYSDPAVLVMDELGQFIVPLLSGHQGGANEFARQIRQSLLQSQQWTKFIRQSLSIGPQSIGQSLSKPTSPSALVAQEQQAPQVVITTANAYLTPIYTVGMGCERDCPITDLLQLLEQCLAQAQLSIEQINSIHSIDIKADEQGLITLAQQLVKDYRTWNIEQLTTVESQLSTKSDYVFSVVGVYGVAESAALYGAAQHTQQAAELVLNKQKSATATCAIARSYPSFINENL